MRKLNLMMLVIILLLVSGCWDRKEMNRIAIVSATSVDLDEDNQWVISFQITIPEGAGSQASGGGGGGSKTPVMVLTSKGATLQEATQKANMELPRTLFFAHNRVIVISKRVAKKGINEIVDHYLRSTQSRETTHVTLFDGDSKQVLEVLSTLEKNPGSAIEHLIKGDTNGTQTNIGPVEMHNLIESLTNSPSNSVLPEIKIPEDWKSFTSLDAFKETGNKSAFRMGRIGLFKEDKLTGWLSKEDGKGLAWVKNNTENLTVSFPCSGEESMKDGSSSFVVDKAKTKLKPKIMDGNLMMNVDINAKGTFLETSCKLELKKPETMQKVEEIIQQQIENDVKNTFMTLASMKTDVLGFGEKFHKTYPKQWKKLEKNWEEEFPKIKLNVSVKTTISRIGLIDNSFSKISGAKSE